VLSYIEALHALIHTVVKGNHMEELTKSLKESLSKLESMTELEKLKFVCGYLANENNSLRQQLKYKEQSDYAIWWDRVKDIPLT